VPWTRRSYGTAPRPRSRPLVRQVRTSDAGPACLAAVCRYYGKRIGLNATREAATAVSRGATLRSLRHAAETLGFDTAAGTATIEQLGRNHLPAIAGMPDGRWLVVYAVRGRTILVADPASSRRRLSVAEFSARWTRQVLYLRPTDAFAEVRESRPSVTRFLSYLRPQSVLIGEALLASLVIQMLGLALPVFARFVIDDVIARRDERWLIPSLEVMGAVVALSFAASVGRRYLVQFVSRQADSRLAVDFYRQLLALPARFFDRRLVGDVVGRFDEAGKITQFLTGTGAGFFIDMGAALLSVALMLHYNVPLTAFALAVVGLEALYLYVLAPRMGQGLRELFQEGLDADGLLIETLSSLRSVKLLAIEHRVRGLLENRLVRLINASLRTVRHRVAGSVVSQLLTNAGTVAVLFAGAVLVLRNELTVGTLVAFTILTRGLTQPFVNLASVWGRLQDVLNSVEQLNDVFETPADALDEPPDDRVVLHRMQGHVRVADLSFKYEEDGPDVVHGVSFEVYAGQRVAIVGRSGSGKSTIVKLLLGLYRPTRGTVSVDGFDVTEIWAPSLRRQVGAVLQDPYLFRGTIRANIAQTVPAAPMADVVAAARLVNAHAFITRLPHGYETELEQNGANLSGGQRQQIMIARALAQPRRMVVLDEATSSLDSESERLFHQNLDVQFRDATVFTVTQRLHTIRHADLIVVMDRGRVSESGDHAALMSRQGLYFSMYVQQNP
jgi:ATP-binding cassette subfamily B protein